MVQGEQLAGKEKNQTHKTTQKNHPKTQANKQVTEATDSNWV